MTPQELADRLGLKEPLTEQPDLDLLKKWDYRNTYALDEADNLIGLNLRGNHLTDDQIKVFWELPDLQVLNLSENQFSSITIPSHLQALRFLNLSENAALKSLVFKAGLKNLHTAELSECALREVDFPAGFDQLRFVYLQKNQLERVTFRGSCPALVLLDLSENKLTEFLLPSGFEQLTDLQLGKNENLQTPPPEMVEQGSAAVLNYFREQEAQGTDTLYEAKLLIVGEGEAGKTSLCRRLIDPTLPLPETSETTKGIDIHRYEFPHESGKTFRVNVWDFGGQEIYHATHQFFLTKRSLYILLDDTKKDHKSVHDEGFKYWLEVIELLGGDSPVLIFQNEKGGRSKEIDLAGIKGRFENVKEKYSGNLYQPASVQGIREAIQFQVGQLPHVGESLPRKWIEVRKEIESLAADRPYISQRDYFSIYEKHLTADRDRALLLSRYLHDLGVFLHFQDDDLLQQTVILQNTWATEAVFRILDDEDVKAKRGYFDRDDCKRIWRDSAYADMHPQLLALMSKFELCYLLPDSRPKTWLAPQLLPPSQPETLRDWDRPGDLAMRYQYDFLPKGIINRLMVRNHAYVERPGMSWKNGVFFEREDNQLLARISPKGDEILLRARGPERKELLSAVSYDLDALNRTFSGLSDKVVKKVPCICGKCLQQSTPEFYDYEELKRRRKGGKDTIECRASYQDVPVIDLLEGVEAEGGDLGRMARKKPEPARGRKVFFSYSQHDRAYLEQLQRHLAGLRRKGKIRPWHDAHILPGEDWDAEIKKELASAEIILLLISADFLATDYIWEEEVTRTMERHERGEACVIPILLRKTSWEAMPFAKLQALPNKARPVSSFADRDEAWLEVVKGIEKVLDAFDKE